MQLTLSGAEIVGFIIFCMGVGPALFMLGRLSQRVTNLETAALAAEKQRAEMQEALNDMHGKVAWIYGRMKNGQGHD